MEILINNIGYSKIKDYEKKEKNLCNIYLKNLSEHNHYEIIHLDKKRIKNKNIVTKY